MTKQYSDEEFHALLVAIRRFADTALDQWVHWRLATSYNDVFITIGRAPQPVPEHLFWRVSPEEDEVAITAEMHAALDAHYEEHPEARPTADEVAQGYREQTGEEP